MNHVQHDNPVGTATASAVSPFPGSRVANRPAGQGNERPITLWTVLDAFRRRWVPCLATAIPAALITALAIWSLIPAQYESEAFLKVNQYEADILEHTADKGSEADFLNYRDSQINLLTSRPVHEDALKVDGVMQTQTLLPIQHGPEWLAEKLVVEEGYSAEFIRLSLSGEHPEDLAFIVDSVIDVYFDKHVYGGRRERVAQLNKMKAKLAEYQDNVKQNQDRIANLARSLGTGDAKVAVINQQIIQEDIRSKKQELLKIEAAINAEEAKRSYLRERGYSEEEINSASPGIGLTGAAALGALPTQTTAAGNQTNSLKQELSRVQQKIAQFEDFSRNLRHPDYLALKKRRDQLAKSVSGLGAGPVNNGVAISNYEYLLKQRENLEEKIEQAKEDLKMSGERIVELERENEIIAPLINSRDDLAAQINAREIELEAPQRISVVQEPNVPEKRSVKKRNQMMVAGAGAVFGMIVLGFTMFEWFSHRLSSTSDIAECVNLRLVGSIPSPDKGGVLGTGILAGRVDYDEWNRAVIESMDVVRTYLMRHVDPSRSTSILITSSSPNEGKTTVSCQLAASLSRAGKRVAIVDCDFRRPSAHTMLDAQPGPGLCEYLRGEIELEKTFQATQAPGLTFIPAGSVDQVVLQRLSIDGGRQLINDLKEKFDFVIIDTSPMLFVAEPSMLAQNADIVLMSTRKDYSRIPYVAQCRDSLRSLQVPLLGAVMVGSDSDFQRESYGYRQEVRQHVRV